MAPTKRGPITHAGGVVARVEGKRTRYLLVSAKRQPDLWVLPKGHLERGESASEAAAREVLEEAGVVASVISSIGVIEFDTVRGHVRSEFFLMRYEGEGQAGEERRLAWMTLDQAVAALTFDDMRQLVRQADRLANGKRPSS